MLYWKMADRYLDIIIHVSVVRCNTQTRTDYIPKPCFLITALLHHFNANFLALLKLRVNHLIVHYGLRISDGGSDLEVESAGPV